MAAVLSPKSSLFPHDILGDSRTYGNMDRTGPSKPSLPSISSLIEHIDKQVESTSKYSSDPRAHRKSSASSNGLTHSPTRHSFASSPRSQYPPTPPLPGTSSFDFPPRHHSASVSPSASTTRNGYFGNVTTSGTLETYAHHRSSYPPLSDKGNLSPNHSPTHRRVSDESLSQDSVRTPQGQGFDPMEVSNDCSGHSQQRPLPANFPPPMPSNATHSALDSHVAVPYQHHHHYPMANSPAFSQNTDRYICPTCQKAFSRPSSLKIHIYSHTGEKPFKCKYDGCGKFFSVRSNMKRHEKGCHGAAGGDGSSAGGNSPEAM